jgi:hypothetical protein
MPGFPKHNTRSSTRGVRTDPNKVKETVTAAKVLIALHNDERELFDPHSGFGPSYPAITQPQDYGVICAAETLMAISHLGGDAISLFDGHSDGSAGPPENPNPPCRNYYPEEHVATKRGRARHSGNTTEDDDLGDNCVSSNEARTDVSSDEDKEKVVMELRPRIKLILPPRRKPRDDKGKVKDKSRVTKRPRTPPKVKMDEGGENSGKGKTDPGAKPVKAPPTRRRARAPKRKPC